MVACLSARICQRVEYSDDEYLESYPSQEDKKTQKISLPIILTIGACCSVGIVLAYNASTITENIHKAFETGCAAYRYLYGGSCI